MAKLPGPPNWGIIGRLKPPLDFYTYKGLWVVRYYPPHIHQPGTEKQKQTWCAMKDAIRGWNDLNYVDREAFTRLVRDAHRSGKDFYYRLHLKYQIDNPDSWYQYHYIRENIAHGYLEITIKCNKYERSYLYYCFDHEQRNAFYWASEGYCIRGRKLVRKRILYEEWPNKIEESEIQPGGFHIYQIPVTSGIHTVYYTIKPKLIPGLLVRGRTGVYISRL